MKRKTRTREHKDLQSGQFSVQFEEVGWNCSDLDIVQPPERKEVEMRGMKSKNKNTGTQKLTIWTTKCSRRGSHLESYRSGYGAKP